jgi:hypothetical protein
MNINGTYYSNGNCNSNENSNVRRVTIYKGSVFGKK